MSKTRRKKAERPAAPPVAAATEPAWPATTAVWATIAFALLSWALYLSDGHYEPQALQLAIAGAIAVLAAVVVPRWPRRLDATLAPLAPWLLLSVLGAQLYGLWNRPPGLYITPGLSLQPIQIGLVLAGLVAATYVVPKFPGGAFRIWILVAIYCGMAGWMIFAAPRPFIDVWYYEQRAAALLLHGQNPWAAEYPNIYGHTMFFGAQLIKNGRIQSHTYPPLSVLMTLPGFLAGDARWSLVASTAGAAALAIGAARKRGLPAGHVAELGVALLLFHSRALFLVEEAWTEPFVAVWAAFVLLALTLERRAWLWIAVAGFLSVKQYGLLWLPALWIGARLTLKDLLWIGLICIGIELPFLIWDASALWNGVMAYQFKLQFRPDSLSIPAWMLRDGQEPPQQAGFVAAVIAGAIVVAVGRWQKAPSASKLALGGCLVLYCFFLFHKQAFFNYYWLVGALLAYAIVLSPVND